MILNVFGMTRRVTSGNSFNLFFSITSVRVEGDKLRTTNEWQSPNAFDSIVTPKGSTVSEARFTQPLKAALPIRETESGMTTLLNEVQFMKDCESIDETWFGMTISLSSVQEEKHDLLIFFIEGGRSIFSRDEQCSNALSPMLCKLDGRVM